MSIWIRTFSPFPLGALQPDDMRAGIQQRLALLTYLFCPEEEENPEEVLSRLRIDKVALDVFQIRHRSDSDFFIRVEKWAGEAAEEEVEEALENLQGAAGPGVEQVRAVLSRTIETVAFELKARDAQGMGWPLAIAAAAKIAEQCEGLVKADGCGWMVPRGNEVAFLVDE